MAERPKRFHRVLRRFEVVHAGVLVDNCFFLKLISGYFVLELLQIPILQLAGSQDLVSEYLTSLSETNTFFSASRMVQGMECFLQ